MIVKELFAKLGLDVDMTGFAKADTLMDGLKASAVALSGIVVGVAAGLAALVVHTADTAFEIQKMAQTTGLTTDALQELQYAAQRAGVSSEEMDHGLMHLARSMNEAKQGSQEQAKAFAQIGVRVTEADGHLRDTGDTLADIAEHFKSMPDGADKTALSMQLFGRAGAMLIPVLNKGRDGLAELAEQAHAMGVVLDQDAIEKSKEFRDALLDVKLSAQGVGYSIANELMPMATDYVRQIGAWMRANRELIKQRIDRMIKLVGTVLTIALVPLRFFAGVLGAIIDNWRMLVVILSSIVLAALVVNAAQVMTLAWEYITLGATSAAAALKSAAAWALANAPLILLAAIFVGIILLMDDIVTALDGGDSAMKKWLGNWKDDNNSDAWWLRDLKTLAYLMLHFGPIFDFWKGEIQKFWDWLKDGFANTWDDIVVGVKSLFGIHDDRNDAKKRKKVHYAAGYLTDKSSTLGPGEWRTNSMGEQMWYPFSDVDDAANAKFVGMHKAGSGNTFEVNQIINGGPNATPSEIADKSADALEQFHKRKLAEADAEN